ncbi:unnamed protein product [Caenorhabditis angaria]|uniref:CX domain-containing protein n=1 Tax=Caenorhabditis angaria TaxID=860376 RepID=A0A9P1NC21_9PELO|nr:unnamed protein product [Caenorhabditis angaria]
MLRFLFFLGIIRISQQYCYSEEDFPWEVEFSPQIHPQHRQIIQFEGLTNYIFIFDCTHNIGEKSQVFDYKSRVYAVRMKMCPKFCVCELPKVITAEIPKEAIKNNFDISIEKFTKIINRCTGKESSQTPQTQKEHFKYNLNFMLSYTDITFYACLIFSILWIVI